MSLQATSDRVDQANRWTGTLSRSNFELTLAECRAAWSSLPVRVLLGSRRLAVRRAVRTPGRDRGVAHGAVTVRHQC